MRSVIAIAVSVVIAVGAVVWSVNAQSEGATPTPGVDRWQFGVTGSVNETSELVSNLPAACDLEMTYNPTSDVYAVAFACPDGLAP